MKRAERRRRKGGRRKSDTASAASPPIALSSLRKARILVVGDAMLDRYWMGVVERISPEAPVPIVRIDEEVERPGGAANVARNAAALGARVTLLSVVGADEPGARLESLLRRERITSRLHHG